ncbi:MAG: hypothetical protein LBR57_04250 [Alistipes sp.]|jgi:hypothetical protein|nr:hypothetical protein [Alistipes sp.]
MKIFFVFALATTVCCAVVSESVSAQTPTPAEPEREVWASKERAASGYPQWAFEIARGDADSLTLKLTEHSENYKTEYLEPVFGVIPTNGNLKFGITKLKLSNNPQTQKVLSIGDMSSPASYFGGLASTMGSAHGASADITINYFDLDFLSADNLSGVWYRSGMSVQRIGYNNKWEQIVEMINQSKVEIPLTFYKTTAEQLHRENVSADIRNMNARGGKYKYLGRYTTEKIALQYPRPIKVAHTLTITGIVFEAVAGTSLIGYLAAQKSIDKINMREEPTKFEKSVVPVCAALFVTGASLHIGGTILKKKTYNRFLREQASYLDLNASPAGLSMSYNF